MINVFLYVDALPLDCATSHLMPFMNNVMRKGETFRLANILGYSFGIQSTMLSGQLPSHTKYWMPYVRSQDLMPNPYKPLSTLAKMFQPDIENSRMRFLRYVMTSRLLLRRSAHICSLPWSLIDRFFIHRCYFMCELPHFESLRKELLRRNNCDLVYFGPPHQRSNRTTPELVSYLRLLSNENTKQSSRNTFILGYLDGLDHKGHAFGTDDLVWRAAIKSIDKEIEIIYDDLEKSRKDFNLLVFSDHGMCNVEETIDILGCFRRFGLEWHKISAFVDATILNIWVERRQDKRTLAEALDSIGTEKIIVIDRETDTDLLRRCGVLFDDRSYGDVIVQTKPGFMFFPNFYSDLKKFKGIHGFMPSEDYQKSFLSVVGNAYCEGPPVPHHIKDIREMILSVSSPRSHAGESAP